MNEIEHFWQWFLRSRNQLRKSYEADDWENLDREISPRVNAINSRLKWELASGEDKPYAFVISPNRDRELLRITEEIVSKAPVLPDWEFYAARPPKKWDLKFEMINNKNQKVMINASGWRYTLIGFNDNSFFDITLYLGNLPRMDSKAREIAAGIVLEGVLGERVFIEKIDQVKLLSLIDSKEEQRSSSITDLSNHLKMLSK